MPTKSAAGLSIPSTVLLRDQGAATLSKRPCQSASAVQRLGFPRVPFSPADSVVSAHEKVQHVAFNAIARVPAAHLVLVDDAHFGETDYATGLRPQAKALSIDE